MELGWLAPDGSFYAAEWSSHYGLACKLADKYGYNTAELHADDVLIQRGWVHITKSYFDYQYRAYWRPHLTAAQKEYLAPFFKDDTFRWSKYTVNSWKYENTDWEDDMDECWD